MHSLCYETTFPATAGMLKHHSWFCQMAFITAPPKTLWIQGKQAIQHLQRYKAPCLGRATLAQWLESVMESQELLSDSEGEEEAISRQAEPPRDKPKQSSDDPLKEGEEET